MFKIILITFAISLAAFLSACGGGTTNSSTNANGPIKVDQANLPPGFSASPVPPSANSTPGIPPVVANLPKGATPTPGIPSPEDLKKPMKPGLTPTPGIPSPEELKRQMGQPPSSNGPPPMKGDNPGLMKKRNVNKLQ